MIAHRNAPQLVEPASGSFAGLALTISFEVKATPKPSCGWTLNGNPIRPGSKFRTNVEETVAEKYRISLWIKSFSLEDHGLYRCEVRNFRGRIVVEFDPKSIVRHPNDTATDKSANQSENVFSTLVLSSDLALLRLTRPPLSYFEEAAKFKWTRENVDLVEENCRFRQIAISSPTSYTSCLAIHGVSQTDLGPYTLTITSQTSSKTVLVDLKNLDQCPPVRLPPILVHKPFFKRIEKGEYSITFSIESESEFFVDLLVEGNKPCRSVKSIDCRQSTKTPTAFDIVINLKSAQFDDSCVCVVMNLAGGLRFRLRDVNKRFGKSLDLPVIMSTRIRNLKMGDTIVESVVLSTEIPRVRWFDWNHNEIQPQQTTAVMSTQTEGKQHTVKIRFKKRNVNGRYKLLVSNRIGETFVYAIVARKRAPESKENENMTFSTPTIKPIDRRIRIELDCSMPSSSKNPVIRFIKNDNLLSMANNKYESGTSELNNGICGLYLEIRNPDQFDVGDYELEVEDEWGKVNRVKFSISEDHVINSLVSKRPQFTTKPLWARRNDSVVIAACFVAEPKPSVQWKMNEQSIDESKSRITNDSNSTTLEIKSFDPSLAGLYECVIENRYGSDKCQCRISAKMLESMEISADYEFRIRPRSLFDRTCCSPKTKPGTDVVLKKLHAPILAIKKTGKDITAEFSIECRLVGDIDWKQIRIVEMPDLGSTIIVFPIYNKLEFLGKFIDTRGPLSKLQTKTANESRIIENIIFERNTFSFIDRFSSIQELIIRSDKCGNIVGFDCLQPFLRNSNCIAISNTHSNKNLEKRLIVRLLDLRRRIHGESHLSETFGFVPDEHMKRLFVEKLKPAVKKQSSKSIETISTQNSTGRNVKQTGIIEDTFDPFSLDYDESKDIIIFRPKQRPFFNLKNKTNGIVKIGYDDVLGFVDLISKNKIAFNRITTTSLKDEVKFLVSEICEGNPLRICMDVSVAKVIGSFMLSRETPLWPKVLNKMNCTQPDLLPKELSTKQMRPIKRLEREFSRKDINGNTDTLEIDDTLENPKFDVCQEEFSEKGTLCIKIPKIAGRKRESNCSVANNVQSDGANIVCSSSPIVPLYRDRFGLWRLRKSSLGSGQKLMNGDSTNGATMMTLNDTEMPNNKQPKNGVQNCRNTPINSDCATNETFPVFIDRFGPRTIVEGSTLLLKCVFTGYPKPQAEWFRNQQLLPGELSRHTENETNLTITNVSQCDSGHYRCRIRNTKGSLETLAFVHVIRSDLHRKIKKLCCKTNRSASTQSNGNEKIGIPQQIRVLAEDQKRSQRNFHRRSEPIHAENTMLTNCSQSFASATTKILRFSRFLKSMILNEGSTLNLTVLTEDRDGTAAVVQWYRNNMPIPFDGEIQSSSYANSFRLKVPLLRPEDSGVFSAIAYSVNGWTAISNCSIIVKDSETIFNPCITSFPQSISVENGKSASFCCEAFGTEPMTAIWFKSGNRLPHNDHFRQMIGPAANIFSLNIDCVSEKTDSGTYEVRIANTIGDMIAVFDLHVH